MDCMEAKALKSSLHGELALKSTQQTFFDDFFCATGFACMPNEDFSIDELLDFSNEEVLQNCDNNNNNNNDFVVGDIEKDDTSVLDDDNSSNSGSFSAAGDSCPLGELSVPDDYLAELEWVSQFVDDSPSELSLLCPVSKKVMKEHKNRAEPVSGPGLAKPMCLPKWSKVKSRSKRPRVSKPVWAIGSPASSSGLTNFGQVVVYRVLGEPPMKKAKKRVAAQGAMVQFQRRCSHCGVQKTPQWRTGPLGPKTLCNACGVRFKSGRLFPEYRPACSPTFCSDVHSNSHRKVLEMRKKKELTGGVETSLSHMVQIF